MPEAPDQRVILNDIDWWQFETFVVGSAQRDLAKIGNEHIRAHAAEGILFRRVLERAAAEHGIACCAFTEDEIKAKNLDAATKRLGAAAGPPWRADERLAASAALMALQA